MNTNPYEYVLAVARHGNFSKAAKSIPISQQGLSKSIIALEQELGFRFFRRSGKKVELTDEGRELLPAIEAMIDAQDKLLANAAALKQKLNAPSRAITIYTTAYFTLGMLKTLEDELVSMGFPETTILELDTHEIVELIKENPESGIGIVNVPLDMYGEPPAPGTIEFEELFSSSLAIMGTTKLISPRKKWITAKDMKTLPISYPNFPILNEMVDELFERYRPENVVSHTSNLASIDRSVLSGKSITITDTITAFLNRDDKDRLYVELDYPVYSNVGFLYAPRGEGLDVRRSYMDAIRNYMKSILGPYIKSHPPRH